MGDPIFNFEFQLDFQSKRPLADQIQDQIQQLIQTGALVPGEQLPTVRQAARQLDVNFNTVARVYRALDQAGLISTRQGRGTYVARAVGKATRFSQLAQETQVPAVQMLIDQLAASAERLQVSGEEILAAVVSRFGKAPISARKRVKKRRLVVCRKPGFPVGSVFSSANSLGNWIMTAQAKKEVRRQKRNVKR